MARTDAEWSVDADVPHYDYSLSTVTHQFPPGMDSRRRWMGVLPDAKYPFAPNGSKNPDCACRNGDCPADRADDPECECDGRFKWGHEPHYVTGREISQTLQNSRAERRAFIFGEDDPFLFVDLDDVRCPDTGEVHPAALAFLEVLGPTWVEVSSSGAGLHAVYDGSLPGGMVEAKPQIDDEPWGANDEVPVIEMYESSKKVGVLTGNKVGGAPRTVEECDEDALTAMLEATGHYARVGVEDRDDASSGSGGLSGGAAGDEDTDTDVETTDDMQAVIDALDALDCRDVADKTIASEWFEGPHADCRSFRPSWASLDYDGGAVYCHENGFKDEGHRGGSGGPVIMAAIDLGIVSDKGVSRGDVSGPNWVNAVEWLRQLGFEIPRTGGAGQ